MKTKYVFKYVFLYVLSLVYLIFIFLPIYDGFISSLQPYSKMLSFRTSLFPDTIYFGNYISVWNHFPLSKQLMNTAIYAISVSIICISFASLSAYSLSRFNFKGRVQFLFVLLATQMISILLLVVPLKIMMIKLGLDNTYFAVILVDSAGQLTFSTWMLWAYFDTIPRDLDEAALVDGCTRLQIIRKILLPLALPGVMVTFLMVFVAEWQSFTVPILFISNREFMPATVGIYEQLGELLIRWDIVLPASFITIIPELAVGYAIQKYIVGGLTAGAVKY